MARSEGQKLKLLYLKELLENESDEKHPVNTQRIIEYLASHGITSERKAIYNDIECLQDFGMDIIHKAGRNGGYYLASREFELPELKLLVDAVQSSKFLTSKKSMQLIEKLSHMVSIHEAGTLKRQAVVSGRVKTMNESIYYNVDSLHEAIAQNSTITFRYTEWGLDGKRHERPGIYEASPYTLIWDDENYYLVAHTERHGITHYRVDKMAQITITGKKRFISPDYKAIDTASYGKNVFGMFSGETTTVRMRFHRSLAGVVIDRFGSDTMLIPDSDDHFIFTTDICVSPRYLGWLAGFGDLATILSPQSVIDQYVALCKPSVEQYSSV
ncbi:MAG: WYL domain-containing protein [Oscillospiraceae bacterium]|nr:WYL domain-containing protein [Oscillospiraceae bacterium]